MVNGEPQRVALLGFDHDLLDAPGVIGLVLLGRDAKRNGVVWQMALLLRDL
jgi:hypothetical protein